MEMEDPFELTAALATDIVGQKRTSKHKQFVFIRKDYVIKGPYQQGRFNNVTTRSQIFTSWNTPCVVKVLDYFNTNDGTFIRFPNIMAGYQLETEPYTESFTGLQYNILKNSPLLKLNNEVTMAYTNAAVAEDLILGLCHCNILGVGDMNVSNVLFDTNKRQYYIIDYDDNLASDRDDATFYFNKVPAKKLHWVDRVSSCYNRVSERLLPLLEDPIVLSNNLTPRVQRAINLLRQYDKSVTNVTTTLEPKTAAIIHLNPTAIVNVNPSIINQPTTKLPAAKLPTAKLPAILDVNQPIATQMITNQPINRDSNGVYFFSKGKYTELSNYWVRKDGNYLFTIDNKQFKSGEHAYQYYKFYYPGADDATLQYAEIVRNASTPNDAKLLANQKPRGGFQSRMNDTIKLYIGKAIINPQWDNIRIDIMRAVVTYKFTQDLHCQQVLLSTSGKMLYEDSPYDSFWGIGSDGNGLNWLGKLLVELRNKFQGLDPNAMPQQVITQQPIPQQVLTQTVTLQTGPIVNKNIGQMVWKGLRGGGTKTFSGISFDVAKSALQKYIRRNMPQKAILSAIELFRLGEVDGNPGVTNMYNRLAIIANEDIGPANLPLVLEVTRIVESGDRDPARLVAMVQLMCESPKTRMMSHAWRAYATIPGRKVSNKIGLPVDKEFTESDIAYIKQNTLSDLFLPSDPDNIRPYVLIFLKRLYEKDFNAFSWAYFFLEATKDMKLTKRKKFIQGTSRNSTGKPDILLWNALSKILSPETHDILVDAYYNHSENRPFLQNAILTALYEVPYKKLNIEPAVDFWNQQPLLKQMLDGNFTLDIDPFVIDKHTQQGRAMGKNIQDFVDEGAVVSPLAKDFYSETLEYIYKTRT